MEGQQAGRVFFGDAKFTKADDGLWLEDDPIWLHTLSTPKPTTFQHYLVQDRQNGHDPNRLADLAHYGSNPTTTQIRGYKQYWTKGESPDIRASAKELEHKSQLTQVRPVKPGVHFQTTIRFENLSAIELGALLWVLSLPAGDNRDYTHRLGMGKPLGMGAVKIQPTLVVDDRPARYQSLFTKTASHNWDTPQQETAQVNAKTCIEAFEDHILEQLNGAGDKLASLERVRTLLTLLEWHEGTGAWQDTTRYMEIEREVGTGTVNEYRDRPVLPTPEEVAV